MFETNEEETSHPTFPDTEILGIPSGLDLKDEDSAKGKSDKKKLKSFECPHCRRVFQHRNSLLYHILMHSEKQQVCRECGKSFYTASALKVGALYCLNNCRSHSPMMRSSASNFSVLYAFVESKYHLW